MKKLIIWFLSVVILAIVIAIGFFYVQTKPIQNIPKQSNPASGSNTFNTPTSIIIFNTPNDVNAALPPPPSPSSITQPINTYQILSVDKFPPHVQVNKKIEEYRIQIRALGDKGIFRLVNTEIINEKKVNDSALTALEVIYDGKIIFSKQFPISKIIYFYPQNNIYQFEEEYIYINYAVFQSIDNDYFAYSVEQLPSAVNPYVYNLVRMSVNDGNIKATELDGIVQLNYSATFSNPELNNGALKLIEDKYIISTFFDHRFDITAYYEIEGDSIHLTNKEFVIEREIKDWKIEYQKEMFKRAGSIIMYSTFDFSSASSSIPLTENTQVTFIGIRYIHDTNNKKLVHVIIDNTEGWIDEEDSWKLGVSFAN